MILAKEFEGQLWVRAADHQAELASAEKVREGLIKCYTGMAEDAKRYRWLRENLNNTEALEELYKHPGDIPTAEQLDAAIDDAIAKENGK